MPLNKETKPDHRMKLKEIEKKDKHLDFVRKLKKKKKSGT